jgi:hypothetical protein
MPDDEDLEAVDRLLAAALYRTECPPAERLLELQAELLDPAQQQVVRAHIASCRHCAAELAELAAVGAPSPLERLVQAGVRLLRATLEPGLPALAPALRGAAPQRLSYSAGPYQLILVVTAAAAPGATGQIEGQLSDASSAAIVGSAELWQGETLLQRAAVDDLGFLVFDAVDPGSYDLRLFIGDAIIEVNELVIAV